MSEVGNGFALDFTITAEHMVAFLRLRQQTLNRVGGIVAIALILVGLYIAWSGDLLLGAFEVLVGSGMLITSQTTLFDAWRVKRAGRRVIGTRAQLKVDESGIDVRNAGLSSKVDWASIIDLKVSDQIIIPMRGKLPVGWMPTDAFESEAARDSAIAFMRDQIARSQMEPSTPPSP